jgi:hypothetical protein
MATKITSAPRQPASSGEAFYKARSDLESLSTVFLARSYLEGLHTLPRMQDIPTSAFMTNPAGQVFISHAWLNPNQPDDRTLRSIRDFVPNLAHIGLWIDYCCLPQKRKDGTDDRTEEERVYFRQQLQYIPTIILKTQMIVFWGTRHKNRAWCIIEFILADIFKNIIMKQIYHCKEQLEDHILYVIETYNPHEFFLVGGVDGKPLSKILIPYEVKDLPASFYTSVLNDLAAPPMPLTSLLARVERKHVDKFFQDANLGCTNAHDVDILKQLLLTVCHFAGAYDVSAIKWQGKIKCSQLLPYILANTSDFTVNLVDYKF